MKRGRQQNDSLADGCSAPAPTVNSLGAGTFVAWPLPSATAAASMAPSSSLSRESSAYKAPVSRRRDYNFADIHAPPGYGCANKGEGGSKVTVSPTASSAKRSSCSRSISLAVAVLSKPLPALPAAAALVPTVCSSTARRRPECACRPVKRISDDALWCISLGEPRGSRAPRCCTLGQARREPVTGTAYSVKRIPG